MCSRPDSWVSSSAPVPGFPGPPFPSFLLCVGAQIACGLGASMPGCEAPEAVLRASGGSHLPCGTKPLPSLGVWDPSPGRRARRTVPVPGALAASRPAWGSVSAPPPACQLRKVGSLTPLSPTPSCQRGPALLAGEGPAGAQPSRGSGSPGTAAPLHSVFLGVL